MSTSRFKYFLKVAEDEKSNIFSDDSEEEDLYKPPSWQEIVSEKPEFRRLIKEDVEKDFETAPSQFRNLDEYIAPKLRKRLEQRKKQEERK